MQNTEKRGRNRIIFILLFLAFVLLCASKPVFAEGTKVTVTGDIDTSVVLSDSSGDEYVGILQANNDLIFSDLPYGVYAVFCENQLDVSFSGAVGTKGTIVTDNQFTLSDAAPAADIAVQNEQVIKSGFYYITQKDNFFKINTSVPIITVEPETVNVMVGYNYNTADIMNGVSALDSKDGDISANIIPNIDLLDTTVPGTYIITYTVQNSQGVQTSATRTVNVSEPPALNSITADEGQSAANTIDLTPNYTGPADKLYYIAVGENYGYAPADSADLINFVLNGTDVNLSNSDYNSNPHIARGVIDLSASGTPDILTGLEQSIAGDAGLVGGIRYQIYAVIANSNLLGANNDAGEVSNMADLGYYQLAQGFDSGFGSEGSPYIIRSGTTFSHMNYAVYSINAGLYYSLGNDVDLSAFSSGEGWIPIGSSSAPFAGIFDGQNYTVYNLIINNSTSADIGLFGVSNGIIQNVGIGSGSVNSSSTAPTRVGGLVGNVTAGSIINCYSAASASGALLAAAADATSSDGAAGTGGLIGTISGTAPITISDSYSSGTVAGRQDVGGFVGDTLIGSNADIERCWSTGDVSITVGYQAGGFIGKTVGAAVTIQNCYTNGNVTSNSNNALERTGGFAGWIGDTTAGSKITVSCCYASRQCNKQ